MTAEPSAAGLTAPVIELARSAGRIILQISASSFHVQQKSDHTPVTEADLAAHRTIVAGLTALTPDLPILSEEAADVPFEQRSAWESYWLIDPLDGTREFIRRSGEFSVNIALIHAHRPVLGVVHVPHSETTYFAHVGGGAFRATLTGDVDAIRVRSPCRVPPLVAVSRSRCSRRLQRFLDQLGEHDTVEMGSALKACLVAEGRADLYPSFGPTSEWDTAAAQCIVEEAGGRVTDTEMRPLRYNTKESLLNPSFFAFGDPSRDWSVYI